MGPIDDISPTGRVVIGIFVGLVSTSVQSLGLTLQRKSHLLEEEREFQDARRPPYKRRRWQLGMLMFIVSNVVGSTIQITTLPLPVLSTLQASGLVFNSICATLILGEPFTRYSIAGTCLVCIGAVLIAVFGAIPESPHSLDQLLALLGRSEFIIWMVVTAVVVIGILFGTRALKATHPYSSNSPRMRLLRGMAYGAISGILSAHSLLVAKSAVELLVRTIIDGVNQFNRVPSWIILLGLIAFALSQLYFLHRGLKLCSTSILYPFVFCMYNIIAILDGIIYFHQTDQMSLVSALLITLGTIILLTGVFCLSWRLGGDSATKPPVAQNPLTPGLGFVGTDSSDEYEEGDSEGFSTDEEESRHLLPARRSHTLPAKLHPRSANGTPTDYGAAEADAPLSSARRTSTPQNLSAPLPSEATGGRGGRAAGSTTFSPLRVSRYRRAKTVMTPSAMAAAAAAEAGEIWDELEEADTPQASAATVASASSASPFFSQRYRSPSAHSTPSSRMRLGPRGSRGAVAEPGHENDEHGDDEDDERTSLLPRSATFGRSYRDCRKKKRRRRVPAMAGPLLEEGEDSGGRGEDAMDGGGGIGAGGTQAQWQQRRNGRTGSQDAVGGWWKMKRWRWWNDGERRRDDEEEGQ